MIDVECGHYLDWPRGFRGGTLGKLEEAYFRSHCILPEYAINAQVLHVGFVESRLFLSSFVQAAERT